MIRPSPTDTTRDRGNAAPATPPLGVYRRVRRFAGGVRRTAPGMVSMMPRIARVSWQRLLGRSDYARWSNTENLEKWWETRTQALARFIRPNSRVIEFGAGRRLLSRHLPPGCVYFPSDLTSRSPETIVCDLNRRPLPDLRPLKTDVAVFAGVLEYISDVPALAAWLSTQTGTIVTSYDHVKSGPASLTRLVELLTRRNFGYLSNYTLPELLAVFERAGFTCVQRSTWESQELMVLTLASAKTARPR